MPSAARWFGLAAILYVGLVSLFSWGAARSVTEPVSVLTGEAAVTLGATNQGMVAGDLVNTAARIQSAAAPAHHTGSRVASTPARLTEVPRHAELLTPWTGLRSALAPLHPL